MEYIAPGSLGLFDFHMNVLVYKSQWIDRSLPKYIGLRMSSLLSQELGQMDSSSQLSKSACVIDVIYAFAKNARWHSSRLFIEALSLHIYARYQFICPKTIELASDLLGNTTTLTSEADRCFLLNYLSVWYDYPFAESSEIVCGLSNDWYEDLKNIHKTSSNSAAFEVLGWFKGLQSQQSLWQVDEQKFQMISSSTLEAGFVPGRLFSDFFEELQDPKPKNSLSERFKDCQKYGIVFRVEDEGKSYDLSIDGQRLTARFVVSQSQNLSLQEFLEWCEPWQRCFFQTPSPQRKLILSGLVRSENLPKISVFGEFIACLEDEFPEDFCRDYLISALKVQTSNWTRAALLVAGKHLIDQEILDETAARLLDLPSNDIQRLAADLLFT